MTEAEAREWVRAQFGMEAMARLAILERLVREGNEVQNLVAPSTLEAMWNRHLADSAQLVLLAPAEGRWLDIGTGAGFPGLVVAALRAQPTVLVEPRKRRASFLATAVSDMSLNNVTICCAKVEQLELEAAVISARAVATIEKLLPSAMRCATTATCWLLPRGRGGEAELKTVRRRWRGVFHMKQSRTDPSSSIIVATNVSAR